MSKQLLKLSENTALALAALTVARTDAPAVSFTAERPTLPIDLGPKGPAPV